MSWFRRHIGLDGFDLTIHLGVTLLLMTWAGMENSEEAIPMIAIGSLVVLGVRRSIARWRLRRSGQTGGELTTGEVAAIRIAELEERVAELEAAQADVAELAERLDFAERLLAQPPADRAIQRGGLQ